MRRSQLSKTQYSCLIEITLDSSESEFLNSTHCLVVSSMKCTLLWVGLSVSVIATLYCFLAVLMAGSFGATPGYPKALLEYNVSVWTVGTLVFVALTFFLAFLLVKTYRSRR